MKRNAAILFLVIGLIVAGGAFQLRYEAGTELPAPAPAAAVQPPAVQAVAGTSNLPAGEATAPSAGEAQTPDTPNPFAARTWEPPRPVAPVITTPPPPQAPPLPFRFLGRVSDPERGDAFMLTSTQN